MPPTTVGSPDIGEEGCGESLASAGTALLLNRAAEVAS